MASSPYITIPLKDLGAGIDQLSAENAIPEGYSEDLLNTDPKPEGYMVKRTGYQGYGGFLPLRVQRLEYTTDSINNICFYLDGSVNLSSIKSSPLVIFGRTCASHSEGDWDDTDSAHYYDSFTSDIRREYLTGTNTFALTASDTGINNPVIWVGTSSSDSATSLNNSIFYPDVVSIALADNSLDVTYTNDTGSTFPGFIYFKDKQAISGSTFVSAPTAFAPGTSTVTISAGTHGLSNFNILTKVFEDTGVDLIELVPDMVTISVAGAVSITLTNNTSSSFNAIISLSAAPIANVKTGSVASMDTAEVVISTLDTPFLFVNCYLEQTLGGTKEMVIPDSIVIDTAANTATISFQNNSPSAANFFIFYEFATISSNKLCVTGEIILTPYTDENPQLTLWGIDHRNIYTDASMRGGWVTHLDSYRSVGENRLVSGLGGNLFDIQSIEEASTTYLLPTLYPNINNRLDSNIIIGPAFFDSSDSPSRTRGFLQFDGGGEGWARAYTSSWDSNNGWVKYTLTVPSLVINGTLSTIISTITGLEDYLSVQQAGYSVNNGVFRIMQATNPTTDILEIWVDNPSVDSSDWDETDSGIQAGIFTDQLTLLSTSTFTINDRVTSESFTDSDSFIVTASSGNTIVIEGTLEEKNLPLGLRLAGSRTSNIMPLRDLSNNATVENLVRGDLLTYGELARELRVVAINSDNDRLIDIAGDGQIATATLLSGDTSRMDVGTVILLYEADGYTGTQVITSIIDSSSFTFDSSSTASVTGATLKGKVIQLDENLSFGDTVGSSVSIIVPRRWIPIEAPDDNWDLTPSTFYRHLNSLPYNNQAFLRSVMVADNLYLTNGADESFKYDGTNIYRSGLFRWQPHLFVALDSTPSSPNTGEITITDISCAFTTFENNRFTVNIADIFTFQPGAPIRSDVDDSDYTVISSTDDGTNGYIYVDRNITGTPGAGTLNQINVLSYYFRLNAIDANDNIIASAVTGSQDFKLLLATTAQVRIRLVGMPVWDIYDFDRLEVEIYRTKANGVAPFYRLATIPMQFNNGQGYIDYTDTDADDVLRDLDIVNTALLGQELGTRWSHPLTARYVTSAANRLILGNITSDPTIDIQLVDTGTRMRPSSGDAQLGGLLWKFRKDNTDTGTITDMVNRAHFEWVTSWTDDISNITSDATSFTVTSAGPHGLSAGDWVYLANETVTDGNNIQFMGWFQVNSIPSATEFTILDDKNYTWVGGEDVNKWVKATISTDIPVYLGTDGNYGMANGNTDDSIFSYEFTALRRLANAINVSMRKTDVSISGQESFAPWMIANAGNEYAFGQLVITQPKIFDTFLEVTLPNFSGFNIFVNGIIRVPLAQVSSLTSLFPSRILVSYPNYPEIMDNPTSILDSDSDSAIDVNPADGQEITGIIPFFGDSAFGAALKDGVVVVFKTNSIYLVNLAEKAAGNNPVQKVESQGLGCTAPFTIAPTKDGIIFANESGIYKLNRSLQIEYVGRRLERIWREKIDRSSLDEMTGHYYSNGNQYKLSAAYKTDSQNDKVLVYNTVREYTADGYGMGSWTRYDNHPAIAWANLLTEAFFASTKGEVFTLRTTGEVTDYRDDAAAINMEATLRAMDFGDSAIRKAIAAVLVQYRTVADAEGIVVSSAPNLTEDYEELDIAIIDVPEDSQDSLSDSASLKVLTVRYSIDKRKVVYIQIKISNGNIDEPVEVSGVSFRVTGLSEQGTTEAADTGR